MFVLMLLKKVLRRLSYLNVKVHFIRAQREKRMIPLREWNEHKIIKKI